MEVWFQIRADSKPGTGTQSDPFDGSSPAHFDGGMRTIPPDSLIHWKGKMRTLVGQQGWQLQSGWVIEGDGMDSTAIQFAGPAPSVPYITSLVNCYAPVTGVTLRDFTCDGNWAEIGPSSPNGSGGEKNCKTGAVAIYGLNNLVESVRGINTYGSAANGQEQFCFAIMSNQGVTINNILRGCRAELPAGNYGNPFALIANNSEGRLVTKSQIIGCVAVGVNNGGDSPWNSGGANLAGVQNCVVSGCTFIDCMYGCYKDTGIIDGLVYEDNVLTRNNAVFFINNFNLARTDRNIVIRNNWCGIQNRNPGGCNGIGIFGVGVQDGLDVEDNQIVREPVLGTGYNFFRGIEWQALTGRVINGKLLRNIVNGSNENYAPGVTRYGNRDSAGKVVSGLEDTVSSMPQPPGPAIAVKP